jgi:hypothetical protein
MRGQTLFGHICEWCGAPATRSLEVRPAVWGHRKGRRILRERAIRAFACDDHPEADGAVRADPTAVLRRKAKGVDQLAMDIDGRR